MHNVLWVTICLCSFGPISAGANILGTSPALISLIPIVKGPYVLHARRMARYAWATIRDVLINLVVNLGNVTRTQVADAGSASALGKGPATRSPILTLILTLSLTLTRTVLALHKARTTAWNVLPITKKNERLLFLSV